MHNLTKIRLFRLLLKLSWLPALVFVYPFARFRKRLGLRHVFILDRYSLGGAQRVHLDILASIPKTPKLVLFTRHSPDEVMLSAFEAAPATRCLDIHFWCDNLLLRLFTVHYWAFYLNRHRDLRILSSNSTFFYDLLPWLRKDFLRVELLHNFTYGKRGMEAFGLATHAWLDKRLVVDHYTAQNIREQYAAQGVAPLYYERVQVIEPGVELPDVSPRKAETPLVVLYAGRGGEQKRVWLIDRIAAHCYEQGWPIVFHFAGNPDADLTAGVIAKSVMHGQVHDPHRMRELYAQSHVILLTSAYEGFPMFIKEGMAMGCIPVVTALPGNKTHLRGGENALLIENVTNEEAVVTEGIAHLKSLINDPQLRERLSAAAGTYAWATFGKEQFEEAYAKILL